MMRLEKLTVGTRRGMRPCVMTLVAQMEMIANISVSSLNNLTITTSTTTTISISNGLTANARRSSRSTTTNGFTANVRRSSRSTTTNGFTANARSSNGLAGTITTVRLPELDLAEILQLAQGVGASLDLGGLAGGGLALGDDVVVDHDGREHGRRRRRDRRRV